MERYLKINSCIKNGLYLSLDEKIIFNVKNLEEESYSKLEYVGETIEKKSKEILEKYNFQIKYKNFYAYLMREIMRNVVEHSKAKEFSLYLYSNSEGEFGFRVIDSGIGLKKSLETNPNYLPKDNMTALAFAIRPGITRSFKKDPLRSDEWQNSGFGLYMVSNIVDSIQGRFELGTGSIKLVYKDGQAEYNPNIFSKGKRGGTEVLCIFNTRIKMNTSDIIKTISQRGNEYIKSSERFSEYATIKTASKASVLIEQ